MQIGDDLQPLAPQQLNTGPPPLMARALMGGAQHLFGLPQRMLEASEQMRHGGGYDAGPGVELMQMMMGNMPFAKAGAAGVFGGKLTGASKPGLNLERVGEAEQSPYYAGQMHHQFNIVDADGRPVGHLAGSTWDNNFHVGDITSAVPGHNLSDPRVLGTANIRSLVSALRKEFPQVENIRGMRVSGARTGGEGGSSYVRMKLPPAPQATPDVPLTIQRGAPIQSSIGQTLTPIHGANFANRITPEHVMRWLGPKD